MLEDFFSLEELNLYKKLNNNVLLNGGNKTKSNILYINIIDEIINKLFDEYYIKLKKDKYTEKYILSHFNKIKNDIKSLINIAIKESNIKEIINNEDSINLITNLLEKYILLYFFLYLSDKLDLKIILSIINKLYNNYLSNIFNNQHISQYNEYYNYIKNCILIIENINKSDDKILISTLLNKLVIILDNLEIGVIETIILHKSSILHNILKLVIFRLIYNKDDRINILKLLDKDNYDNAKYKYIEILDSKYYEIDYANIEILFNVKDIKMGLAEEMYNMLLDNQINDNEYNNMIDFTIEDKINILFEKKILIPITEDFLRYHKFIESFTGDISTKINKKDKTTRKYNTKIRYIITKINNVKDYYSSKVINNIELKNEIEQLFYKPLIHRKIILMNELEEIEILNKLDLQGKEVTDKNEFYINLKQIRLYPYLEFNFSSKDSMPYKPRKLINAIRYCNIEYKDNSNFMNIIKNQLEYRVINDQMTANIVGVVISLHNLLERYNDPLGCHYIKDLINVTSLDITSNNNNGFHLVLAKIKNIYNNKFLTPNTLKDKKIYSNLLYWLFNKERDKINFKLFNNIEELPTEDYIRLLLGIIYDEIVEITYNSIIKQLNLFDYLTVSYGKKIIKDIEDKLVSIPINSIKYAELMKIIYYNKSRVNIDRYDIIENQTFYLNANPYSLNNVIKLPKVVIEKNKIHLIKIYKFELTSNIINDIDEYGDIICQHIISWRNLIKLKKVDINKFNQELYFFIKKYIIHNNDNDLICKSCFQLVDLKQYTTDIYPGSDSISISYGLDTELENILEYNKYVRSIKNIDKIIEQISNSANLSYYVGSNLEIKLRRHEIVKKVIDLIDIQYKVLFIKDQNKRKIQNETWIKKYGCNLSNFFLFKLDNDIFTYSSKEKDKFKLYKLNNILAYILIIFITEINLNQIIYLSYDKLINYYLFEKFGYNLFNNLYIRISNSSLEKDNNDKLMPIKNYKLLCYVIYYISSLFIKYNMWFNDEDTKNKSSVINLQIQRIIIHTVIACINSILEGNMKIKNNYTYNNFSIKFFNKLFMMYEDNKVKDVILQLENLNKKKVIITEDNKLKYKISKIDAIPIRSYYYSKNNIILSPIGVDIKVYPLQSYYIINKLKEIYGKVDTDKIKDDLYKETLVKIASLYDTEGIKRNIPLEYEEVIKFKLDKLKLTYDMARKTRLKSYINIKEYKKENDTNIYKYLAKIKEEYSKELLDDIIMKLINKLESIIGKNININNNNYYLLDNVYIIDHDYYGNKINNIYILDNENKVKFKKKDNYFKQDVYYYDDNINQVTIYYSSISKHLLGYKDINREYIKIYNSNCYLKINYSIYNQLKLLGFNYIYYKIDKKYKISNLIDYINNLLNNRLENLKNGISEIQLIIYQIINKFKGPNLHKIAKYYQNKLININLSSTNYTFFQDWNFINKMKFSKISMESKVNIDILNNNTYINSNVLLQYLTNDNVILYYIIKEFNFLLDINNNNYIKVNLVYVIINIILQLFKNYMINDFAFNDLNVKNFYELLSNKLEDYSTIKSNINSLSDDVDFTNMSEEEIEKYKEELEMNIEADEALDISNDDANEDFGDEDILLVDKNNDNY